MVKKIFFAWFLYFSVLKLPLCSINPNFGSVGSSINRPAATEQPRRQQGNKLKSSQQSSSVNSQDAATAALLEKFLKSTGADIETKSAAASAPAATPAPVFVSTNGKVRSDRRCGEEFPLDDGTVSECDPLGPNYCCSKWGYCGPGADHCDCPECVDYRNENSPGISVWIKS